MAVIFADDIFKCIFLNENARISIKISSKFVPNDQWLRNSILKIDRIYRFSKFHGTLHWRHNDHDGVSNHQPRGCLLNRLFRRRSKKTSKLRVTGLCAGNSPGTGEFPAQRDSNAENVSIWWRHHEHAAPVVMMELPGKHLLASSMWGFRCPYHYNDVIMRATASQITSPTSVYSTVYSGAYQRKHQNFASLAFVKGIHGDR